MKNKIVVLSCSLFGKKVYLESFSMVAGTRTHMITTNKVNAMKISNEKALQFIATYRINDIYKTVIIEDVTPDGELVASPNKNREPVKVKNLAVIKRNK